MPASGAIHLSEDVRVRELVRRVRWSVRVRWLFIAACLAVGGAAAAGAIPAALEPGYFLGVGSLMIPANLFYRRQVGAATGSGPGLEAWRSRCFVQVLGDYLGLGLITYALGSVETPIIFLVLPNIMLVALFFTRKQSLLITVMGLSLVLLPLYLEALGVLPVVSVLDPSYKELILASPVILGGYIALLVTCVLFCWYLVSVITSSLIKSERALEQSFRAMRRLDEEKTRAMVRSTHELKAPLAAIGSYAATLRDGYAGPLPEKALHAVSRIGERCDRLLVKITEIIRLSNLKTYIQTGTQLRRLDPAVVLAKEAEEAAAAGRPRGIVVRLEASPGRFSVRATAEHLQTLFANLLANAVRYSRDQGEVEVRLEELEGRPAVIVSDRGIGIPAESLPHIFEEHYRARNAVSHCASGTGLGLPIARATAELLGARLDIRSELDRGTTVTVLFPRRAEDGGQKTDDRGPSAED